MLVVKRFIFTCAQNNTPVHAPSWRSITALARHYDARTVVSRFVYDTTTNVDYEKPNKRHDKRTDWWYAKEVMPYVLDERMKVADGLEWCGELQILPTAKRPITGFESYTGRNSAIIPHPKFALQSIASGKYEGTKLIYTTGCVTEKNYIQRKAGQVAQFHHGYGGLLVEVRDDGHWFCRQLNCSEDGTLYDLDVRVKNGKVTTGHRVEAIVWGDAHIRRQDPTVTRLAWGYAGGGVGFDKTCMIDVLRPKYQFFHDLLDFRSRNHHEIGSGRKMYERFLLGGAEDNVRLELQEASRALWLRGRDDCVSVVVASNHDGALLRWLDNADYRQDPKNALTFLQLQTWLYEQMATAPGVSPPIFEHAMRTHGAPAKVKFLAEDESFIVCPNAGDGIECGMHGHLGVNGARGNGLAFARMGRKSVTGHTHSAFIIDGVYGVGYSGQVDMGFNKGPSSWSWTHCVIHPNGKRQMVTMYADGWRA